VYDQRHVLPNVERVEHLIEMAAVFLKRVRPLPGRFGLAISLVLLC